MFISLKWLRPLLALALLCVPAPGLARPDAPTKNDLWKYATGDKVQVFDSLGGHCKLHYTTSGVNAVPAGDLDSDAVPDHVQKLAELYEQVLAFYQSLGFNQPLSDAKQSANGGDGRFDVYLLDFAGKADGSFVQESCTADTCAGFMVQENDFASYGYPSIDYANRILASHEFFHAVQDGYDAHQGSVFVEGSAVWATEKFDSSLSDFESFAGGYLDHPDRSLDKPMLGPVDAFSYGMGIFYVFLDLHVGNAVVRRLWEDCRNNAQGVADPQWLPALVDLLARDDKTTFAKEMATFAFWNLLTGSRFDPKRSYPTGNELPLVAMTKANVPYVDDVLRLFPASAQYVAVPAAGHSQLMAAVAPSKPTSDLQLALVVRKGKVLNDPVFAGDGTIAAVDCQGADEVIVMVVNGAQAGNSIQGTLCIGEADQLSVCGLGGPAGGDAGSDAAPGDATALVGEVAGDTADSAKAVPASASDGGCSAGRLAGGSAGGSAGILASLLVFLLVALRRRRLAVWAMGGLALAGCDASTAATVAKVADTVGDSAGDAAADTVPEADAATAVGDPGLLTLEPGQVGEVAVIDGNAGVRLATPAGTEQFVVVLASTQLTSTAKKHTYSMTLGDVAGLGDPAALQAKVVTGCSLQPWQGAAPIEETPPAGAAPAVGDMRKLVVSTATSTETIDVKVAAVADRAVVWLDVSLAHPATLDQAVIADFLKDFNDLILPRERQLFGMESDLDGDGRVGLVFTPLTAKTAVAFFTACDLASIDSCYQGNQGEFLYLTPPADIKPPYNTPAAIKEILAHECGHLLHFNHKVLRNKLSTWADSSYMIEGFGAFAQDAVGFQAGNLYVAKAGLDGINDFSLANTVIDHTAYDSSKDGVLRGVSYWFVRWLYDRGGGDVMGQEGSITGKGGPALIQALLNATDSVAKAMPSVAGGKLGDVAIDFYTALAASNRAEKGGTAPANSCFSFLPAVVDPVTGKPRGGDVYAAFHGQAMAGPAMKVAEKADGSLKAGGVEYLTVTATAEQGELPVLVSVPAAALPRVRIVRIK